MCLGYLGLFLSTYTSYCHNKANISLKVVFYINNLNLNPIILVWKNNNYYNKLVIRGINFASFYDFSTGFRTIVKVVFFVFHFISYMDQEMFNKIAEQSCLILTLLYIIQQNKRYGSKLYKSQICTEYFVVNITALTVISDYKNHISCVIVSMLSSSVVVYYIVDWSPCRSNQRLKNW